MNHGFTPRGRMQIGLFLLLSLPRDLVGPSLPGILGLPPSTPPSMTPTLRTLAPLNRIPPPPLGRILNPHIQRRTYASSSADGTCKLSFDLVEPDVKDQKLKGQTLVICHGLLYVTPAPHAVPTRVERPLVQRIQAKLAVALQNIRQTTRNFSLQPRTHPPPPHVPYPTPYPVKRRSL